MKKLIDYLECTDGLSKDTDEFDIARNLIDKIYEDFPLLYYSFHNEEAIGNNFDIEMAYESMDEYHSSYYYHLDISNKLEELFAVHYPEKVI
jgi:hypothetical protein